VDAPGNDGDASMPEQVKWPNPWRKMMMMMMMIHYLRNNNLIVYKTFNTFPQLLWQTRGHQIRRCAVLHTVED
jgi:hypothetical protein